MADPVKTLVQRVTNKSVTYTLTITDGLLIDDILIIGAKAEAFRVVTGKNRFPVVSRSLKDYLIRTGVLLE